MEIKIDVFNTEREVNILNLCIRYNGQSERSPMAISFDSKHCQSNNSNNHWQDVVIIYTVGVTHAQVNYTRNF